MIGLVVAVAAEPEVDDAVVQQQRRSLILAQRVERQLPPLTTRAGPGHAGLNQHRPAELLGAGRDVERVQPLHVRCSAPSLVLATT